MISLADAKRMIPPSAGMMSERQGWTLPAHRCLCSPVRRFSALWTTSSVSRQRSDGGSFSHSALADTP